MVLNVIRTWQLLMRIRLGSLARRRYKPSWLDNGLNWIRLSTLDYERVYWIGSRIVR